LVEMTNRNNRWCMLSVASMLALAGCGSDVTSEANVRMQPTEHLREEIARGKIHFIDDYQQGLELAQQQGVPLMLFFTADWCKFCHQMAQEALSQDHVAQLSERFVCVLVDNGSQAALCRDFRVRSYPTILFLSPRGVPLNRVTGKQPSHRVMMEMQSALQAVARAQTGEEVLR
jgi:thiol:disulfide interchange protein